MIYELVKKWSYACNPKNVNYKPFATEPSVKLPLWTQAYEWRKDAIVKQLNETDFYVSSAEGVGGINICLRGRKHLSAEQKAANKLSREAAKRAKI